MQAIQSSLMEMFCKQVLTQQNGTGNAQNQSTGVTAVGSNGHHEGSQQNQNSAAGHQMSMNN